MLKRISTATLFGALACASAWADQAPATANAKPDAPAVSPNPCQKPDPLPKAQPTRAEQRRFAADFDKYRSCTQTYADAEMAAAKAHSAAASKAIEDFNTYAKEIDAQVNGDQQ